MIVSGIALCVGMLLAFCNGANDNFKGVATLYGSSTSGFSKALWWATATTLVGSFVAIFLAQGLLQTFSAKGLVPDDILQMPAFPISVVLAAALTVGFATIIGMPISTTHAITGALVGAGLMAAGRAVEFGVLWSKFFLPLLLSPFIAISGALLLYPLFTTLRSKLGIRRDTCICLGSRVLATLRNGTNARMAMDELSETMPHLAIDSEATCRDLYRGRVVGLSMSRIIDAAHYVSAGAVCFSRALNDTPKIAALMLAGAAVAPSLGISLSAIAMAAGGYLAAKRVAYTMSKKVTGMNSGQGLTANLVTSSVVIAASNFGFPVSTTHVSCGALFGIGVANKQARWSTIRQIVSAWVITLPLAGFLAIVLFVGFMNLGV